MLIGDLTNAPPRHDQIEAEKVRRVTGYLALGRKKRVLVTLMFAVYAILIVSGSIRLYVLALKHPTVAAVASYSCLCSLGLLAVLYLIYYCAIVKNERLCWDIAPLRYIDEDDEPELWKGVAKACVEDAQCEAYRKAVAQTGRALMLGEANLILARVNDNCGPVEKDEMSDLLAGIIARS